MKGKIRVFCRIRPLSEMDRRTSEVVKIEDEFSLQLETTRGQKNFQFDHVFGPQDSQENVFEDINVSIEQLKLVCVT